MSTAPRIGGAIILAAGQSSRFGTDKRRASLGANTSLLQATVRRYAEVFDRLLVAVRAHEQDLAALIAPLLVPPMQRVVYSSRAADGMGFTLADAVAQIEADWQFAFIALGDMPFVTFTTLQRLRQEMRCRDTSAQQILVPLWQGEPGHPVGFSRRHFAALAALTGDAGARAVLRENEHVVRRIETQDPGLTRDVDTPAALPGAP